MVPSEAKKVSGYVLFNIHPTISLKKKKKKIWIKHFTYLEALSVDGGEKKMLRKYYRYLPKKINKTSNKN